MIDTAEVSRQDANILSVFRKGFDEVSRQDASSLSVFRKGFDGNHSPLATVSKDGQANLQAAAPEAETMSLCRVVSSLNVKDKKHDNEMNGCRPALICPSGFFPVKRPRLIWAVRDLRAGRRVKHIVGQKSS